MGCRIKRVASRLFVTEKTVKFHLTNIYKKMTLRSRAQLIVWCMPKAGFVDATASNNNNASPTNETDVNAEEQMPQGSSVIKDTAIIR